MTKIFLSCTISVGLAPLANYFRLFIKLIQVSRWAWSVQSAK